MTYPLATLAALAASTAAVLATPAWAHDAISPLLPAHATTLVSTPLAVEGLTGDAQGNLYTTGRAAGAGVPCPVWRIAIASVTPVVVGYVPAPNATAQCSPSGLAFGPDGRLFLSESDKVYALLPNAAAPATATVYASGVTGTNGLAFDRFGQLWTGDGTTGQGRIWRISPAGAVTEAFRLPPMANAAGVGRSNGTLQGTGTAVNAQPLVANGLAFDRDGDLIVADTARGALWRVDFDSTGKPKARTGCDAGYPANTLCWRQVWVAHPLLEGVDGIALDVAGNVWAAANERNALVLVSRSGQVDDVVRNPPDALTGLRNAGPLEFPTSPFLLGNLLCTANSDGNRRDNAPSTAGELGGAGQPRGKISCLDGRLPIPGLPLPVSASRGR